MKESYEYLNSIYSSQLMLIEKQKEEKRYSLLQTNESPSLDSFLFLTIS